MKNEMRKEADRKRTGGRGRGRTRPNAVLETEIGPTHNRRHVSRNKFSGYRVYFRFAGRRPVPRSLVYEAEQLTYAAAGAISRSHIGISTTRAPYLVLVYPREKILSVTRWSASDVSSDTRCDRLMIYVTRTSSFWSLRVIRLGEYMQDTIYLVILRWNRRRFSRHLFQSDIFDTFRNIGNAISRNIIDCYAKRIMLSAKIISFSIRDLLYLLEIFRNYSI